LRVQRSSRAQTKHTMKLTAKFVTHAMKDALKMQV